MAYRLNFSDYDPPAAPPAPPVAPPTGGSIPGGPAFIGFPQPPDVPCDPTGDGWRGPPGPPGPAMGSFVSDTAPLNPVSGQLWFDSSNPQLYVWFVDPTSAQWVIATAYAGGLTTDAPSDGQTYGRQNGAWLNIAGSGGYLPISGATPMTGPLSLVNAGTSGSYDAQVNVVGGGSQAGHGELNYIAAMHHFCTFDGSEQFRVGAAPGGDEVWEARGSVAEAGATLVTAGTATDVDAVFVAKGNGQFHFGNYNSPLLELVAPNEIITNYLQVTARGSGNPVAVTFAGPAGTNVSGFITAQSTVGGITLANSNGNIATFISSAGTATDYLVVRPATATTNITVRAITGSIAIGGSQLLTNATNGFVLIPNMAGIPTGVPDKVSGGLPIVYDTSDDRLYAYNGSWKPVNSRKTLYVTGTKVGSGADITEDILQTFTIAANQLANVGDMLRVVASGTYISSTDTKNARLRFGPASGGLVAATAICASSGITAGISNWAIEAWIVKTGVNTQSYSSLNSIGGTSNTGTVSGTIAVTDTAATVIGVTGQNATNSVASSVACQVFIVEYIPAGA